MRSFSAIGLLGALALCAVPLNTGALMGGVFGGAGGPGFNIGRYAVKESSAHMRRSGGGGGRGGGPGTRQNRRRRWERRTRGGGK